VNTAAAARPQPAGDESATDNQHSELPEALPPIPDFDMTKHAALWRLVCDIVVRKHAPHQGHQDGVVLSRLWFERTVIDAAADFISVDFTSNCNRNGESAAEAQRARTRAACQARPYLCPSEGSWS
jgi:hypothetical protein